MIDDEIFFDSRLTGYVYCQYGRCRPLRIFENDDGLMTHKNTGDIVLQDKYQKIWADIYGLLFCFFGLEV